MWPKVGSRIHGTVMDLMGFPFWEDEATDASREKDGACGSGKLNETSSDVYMEVGEG